MYVSSLLKNGFQRHISDGIQDVPGQKLVSDEDGIQDVPYMGFRGMIKAEVNFYRHMKKFQ